MIPLAKTLEAALSDPMNDYVAGDVERPLKITAEASFQTWQSGKPADIIDGNSVRMHGTTEQKVSDSIIR